MKIENQPQEKNLVLYVHVRIIDEFVTKYTKETQYDNKKLNFQQEEKILKHNIHFSDGFQNILW